MNSNRNFLFSELILFVLTFSNWIWSAAPSYVWTLNYFTIFCAVFIVAELFFRKIDYGLKYLNFFYPYIIILLLVAYGFFFTDPYTRPQVVKVFFYFILTLLYFSVIFASKRSWFFWLGTFAAILFLLFNVDYISLEASRNIVIGADKKDDINSNIFGFMCIISILNANFNLFIRNDVLIAKVLPKLVVKISYVLISLICTYAVLFATGGSRKGFVLLILVYGLSVFFASRLKFNLARLFLLGFAACFIGLVIGFLVYLSPFFGRFEEIFFALSGQYYEEASYDARILFIEEGIKVWLRSPIIGVWCGFFREWGTYAHSNYIDLLCNYGIVGLVSFYSIYYLIIKKYLWIPFKQNFNLEIKKRAFFCLVFFGILIIWEVAAVTHSDRYFPPLMGAIYAMSIQIYINYRSMKLYNR
jgi:O-antigen ligase